MALHQFMAPATCSPFDFHPDPKEEYSDVLRHATAFRIRPEVIRSIQSDKPGLLTLNIPGTAGLQLDLYRVNVFSRDAQIRTSAGGIYQLNSNHLFYRGMVHGDPNSLAIVSVFEERIQILYADHTGNHRIQKRPDGTYVKFTDHDITVPKEMGCFTDESVPENFDSTSPSTNRTVTGNCIQVYVECDFKSYQDNGNSVPNTEEWVAELWNEVIALYENEEIPVEVSDVFVYTSADPFATINSTSDVLVAFANHISSITYDGRLAHLLSTRTLGGGIAYLDVLCSNTSPCAFSANLSTNIVGFPTYSWTVEVVTHEMGHNIGSRHTHACSWNGNNTQIDDCGNVYAQNQGSTPEGNTCFDPENPIYPVSGAGGTIMSYCHLIGGVGINFNNGFGAQPGAKIRDEYNNADCNTGICAPPECTVLTLPLPGSINADINTNIQWQASPGADGYMLTIGTTPANGSIVNNVNVGNVTEYNLPNSLPYNALIHVTVVPYNSYGNASGCSSQSFTTELNVPPLCTSILEPGNGDTEVWVDAIIYWAHSVGNQTGYKISIGTTPGGTNIANQVDVGNVTQYDHPTPFPYNTTLYVTLTPYNQLGDIINCTSQSFTTFDPVPGDFCTSAIDLPCGEPVEGNTWLALEDPEAFNCGTNIEAPGLWYKFVGNGQNVVINTCAQFDFDTKLNAFSGSCGNLTCVAGNDDFCWPGSSLTFSTTNGMTYYIFVQGWNGAQGTFTLTRECYSGPLYCAAGGGISFYEWISNVTFNSMSNSSGKSTYSDFTEDTITVSRGGTHTLTITPAWQQSQRGEYIKAWIDYNKDGDFNDANEEIFSAGPTTSVVSGSITIPVTAVTGTTRMRVAMRYNGVPGNCGVFNYGEVEDYTVRVKCNLVTTTADSGNGSLRNVSFCVDDGEEVLFHPDLNNQTILVTGGVIGVDGDWKWTSSAAANITIKASGSTSRILNIPAGKSMDIKHLKFIGGIAISGSVIDNDGTLKLRDCVLCPFPGSTNAPLRNNGMLMIYGQCYVVP